MATRTERERQLAIRGALTERERQLRAISAATNACSCDEDKCCLACATRLIEANMLRSFIAELRAVLS